MGAADRALAQGYGFRRGGRAGVDADVQVEVLGEEVLEFAAFDDLQPVIACGEGLGFRAGSRGGHQDAGGGAFPSTDPASADLRLQRPDHLLMRHPGLAQLTDTPVLAPASLHRKARSRVGPGVATTSRPIPASTFTTQANWK
jgi:hypothetical protein